MYHTAINDYRAALPPAQKFHDMARARPNANDRLFGERMLGAAKHLLGNHVEARRHLEHVLTHYTAADHDREAIRFVTDVRLPARVFLARVLWLLGFPDRAAGMAEETVQEAQATGHALSQCYALTLAACPVALWSGNLTAAAGHTRILLDLSKKHGLSHLANHGLRYQRVVALKGGGVEGGPSAGESGVDEIDRPDAGFRAVVGLNELVEALAEAGRSAEGFALLKAEFDQSEVNWATPELVRLRGELVLLQGAPAVAEAAGDLFRQALDGARRQAALSWELRAATSLARLLGKQGRHADAIACLHPIYDRFEEGFGTADLVGARQLLDQLRDTGRR